MHLLLRLLKAAWTVVVIFACCGYLQTILRTDISLGDKVIMMALLSAFVCFANWEYRGFRRDILEKIAANDSLDVSLAERRRLVDESNQILRMGGLDSKELDQ